MFSEQLITHTFEMLNEINDMLQPVTCIEIGCRSLRLLVSNLQPLAFRLRVGTQFTENELGRDISASS